jgi:hypothetical protein
MERTVTSRLPKLGLSLLAVATAIWFAALAASGPARTTEFMPHGFCYMWNPAIVWLHVISDSLIALSYYCIPLTLIYLLRRRRDLPFQWIFIMFGAFIVSCGSTHLMEVWTVWHASYLASGILKAFTAGVSVLTAGMLVVLLPKAITLPSPEMFRVINEQLNRKIGEREQEERKLRAILEERDRTLADLSERESAIAELKATEIALQQSLDTNKRITGAMNRYPRRGTVSTYLG